MHKVPAFILPLSPLLRILHPARIDSDGSVLVSDPETDPNNTAPAKKGVIGSRMDVDLFSFTAGAGPLSLTVTPAWVA